MKKNLLFISLHLFIATAFAQLPNTDIWLLDVQSAKGTFILSNPVNITHRTGYDNQPSFSPDGKTIYYTAMTDGKQTDIYTYDLKTKINSQFTHTFATSEYSPMITPDGKNISVVMVEPDSTQRLWQFPINGGAPTLLMDKVDSVGYYCWINKDSLALVMITDPATLKIATVKTQQTYLYTNEDEIEISRSLNYDKKSKALFFATRPKDMNAFSVLNYTEIKTKSIRGLDEKRAPQLESSVQDFAVMHAAKTGAPLLCVFGLGPVLLIQDNLSPGGYLVRQDLSSYGIKNITRIAISPDGKKMAIVTE